MPYKNNIKMHSADICVIGGGLAGMCAAISAARHSSKVILVHDRPVLGGNCSSEVRMWPLGAHGNNRRETGIFEELILNNMYRNPTRNYPIWDSVLYEAVKNQENITVLLNCSVFGINMFDDKNISSVTGWQTTTYTHHIVSAKIFIDCSGDSIRCVEETGFLFVLRFSREMKRLSRNQKNAKCIKVQQLFYKYRCNIPSP